MTKVLVVDDENDIVELLFDDLTNNGFDVISAENGASALGQIIRERPDVVLMDIMMPVVDGYKVLKTLRRDPVTKNLPVVLLTAVAPTEGEKIAVELGANHYVTKPWDLATLEAVIRVAVREAERAGGAYIDTSGFISTGSHSLDTKLGGGVPMSGVTLIEGGTSSGKSVVCQQFAYSALSNGYDTVYYSTQYSPNTLITQMGSLGLDASMHYLSGAFQIKEVAESDPIEECPNALSALSKRIKNLPQQVRFIFVDAVTSLVNLGDDEHVRSFFDRCKSLGNEGRSIFLTVDPAGITPDTLFRVREKSNAYLSLRMQKDGARLRNVLEVCKVRNAEELTGNIVAFSVEPGMGIKLDATRRARVDVAPFVRIGRRSFDTDGLGIT